MGERRRLAGRRATQDLLAVEHLVVVHGRLEERLAEVAADQRRQRRFRLEGREVCVRRLVALAVFELVAKLLVDEHGPHGYPGIRALAPRLRQHGTRQAFVKQRLQLHSSHSIASP